MLRRYKTDVLVIGTGAAGLRTAIEVHDLKKKVLLIGRCKHGDAHTNLATGGINAALATVDKKDNWLIHAVDTLKEGQFLADPIFVETLCKNAPAAVKELVRWGAKFAKDKRGVLIQRFFGAHTYRRTCFYGDQTGKEMMRVLIRQAEKRELPFLDEVYISHLIIKKGKAKGVLGINTKNGDIVIINSKVTILATGGYSRLYSRSSSRIFENFGEGLSMAYHIGAELMDMEMLQFHPTGMIYPEKMIGVLVTEAVRGEGGHLTNNKGERFMKNYDKKRMELSARDIVARSNYNEIQKGRGTKHGGVWLDISHKKASYIKKRLPKMYNQFMGVGVDITKKKMEVGPTAHYSMGGIRTDIEGKTNIKNLLAVGECTGDVHGGNRLGGNSLAETIVYGKIVGTTAAKLSKKTKLGDIKKEEIQEAVEELNSLFKKGSIKPVEIKEELQKIMWKHAGIIRDRKSLQAGLKKLKELEKKVDKMNVRTVQDLITATDAKNMVKLSEFVVLGALMRKESRGAHYRSDYTKLQPHPKHTLVKNVKGKPKFSYKRTPKPTGRLKKFIKKEFKMEYHYLE